MQQSKKKFVVITGATGRLGYHAVREFVNQGYEVRILSRSVPKAKAIFFDIFDKIELIECDFVIEISRKNLQIFSTVLQKSLKHTLVTHIVSIAGSSGYIDRNKTEILDYKCHKYLIDSAKNIPTLEKFIYISSMAITRPWSIVSLVLNLLIKNVMSWKFETENYLRNSGLNHVIIRPGSLLNERLSKPTAVTIAQGDKDRGMIERSSVAKAIVSVCQDHLMKTKVTFEVFSKKEQRSQKFEWHTPNLEEDGRKINKNSHFKVRMIVVLAFWGMAFGIGGWVFKGKFLKIFKKMKRKFFKN